jgi:hypothetical protein
MVSACVAVINPRLFFTYGGRRGVSRDFIMRDSGRHYYVVWFHLCFTLTYLVIRDS